VSGRHDRFVTPGHSTSVSGVVFGGIPPTAI
jgi:hypothetical protein